MNDYNQDFYGWTQQQAALLRAGRWNEIDIENLIEEVETMGRSEKRALESRLTVLLAHLLKWRYQPDRRGNSWRLTIVGQRIKFTHLLLENPGIKPLIPEMLVNAYRLARIQAAKATDLELSLFPVEAPWTYEQIIAEGYFPDD